MERKQNDKPFEEKGPLNMKKLALILAIAASTFAASARGQVGLYAMGSAGRLSGYSVTTTGITTVTNSNNGLWAYGGTFGLYDNFLKLGPVRLGSDVRGFIQTSSAKNTSATSTNKLRGGLVGLRLAAGAPLLPIKPYIQAEIGGASTNFGLLSSDQTGFIYQVQVGADFTVIPHFDLRAEYGAGQFTSHTPSGFASTSSTLQQLGAGAVIRF